MKDINNFMPLRNGEEIVAIVQGNAYNMSANPFLALIAFFTRILAIITGSPKQIVIYVTNERVISLEHAKLLWVLDGKAKAKTYTPRSINLVGYSLKRSLLFFKGHYLEFTSNPIAFQVKANKGEPAIRKVIHNIIMMPEKAIHTREDTAAENARTSPTIDPTIAIETPVTEIDDTLLPSTTIDGEATKGDSNWKKIVGAIALLLIGGVVINSLLNKEENPKSAKGEIVKNNVEDTTVNNSSSGIPVSAPKSDPQPQPTKADQSTSQTTEEEHENHEQELKRFTKLRAMKAAKPSNYEALFEEYLDHTMMVGLNKDKQLLKVELLWENRLGYTLYYVPIANINLERAIIQKEKNGPYETMFCLILPTFEKFKIKQWSARHFTHSKIKNLDDLPKYADVNNKGQAMRLFCHDEAGAQKIFAKLLEISGKSQPVKSKKAINLKGIASFTKSFYESGNSDLNTKITTTDFYADKVDFFGELKNLKAIKQEQLIYEKKWPKRKFEINNKDIVVTELVRGKVFSIKSKFKIHLENPQSSLSGRRAGQLTVSLVDGELKIIMVKSELVGKDIYQTPANLKNKTSGQKGSIEGLVCGESTVSENAKRDILNFVKEYRRAELDGDWDKLKKMYANSCYYWKQHLTSKQIIQDKKNYAAKWLSRKEEIVGPVSVTWAEGNYYCDFTTEFEMISADGNKRSGKVAVSLVFENQVTGNEQYKIEHESGKVELNK